jgi:N-acetylmuramoyl-L-alanine amidase
MASIPWLADVLREAGVQVVEEGNWLGRGVSGSFNPIGVLWHHTAATSSPSNPAPALGTCINGRNDLQGPLCHALVDYYGVFHLISANRANHAGWCGGSGPIPVGDGNTMLIGWEIDYNGVSQQMTPAQYSASVKATAAVLRRLGRDASYARGHRETSVTGKIDPSFINLDTMRSDVAAAMTGQRFERFAFANADGYVFAKDGAFASWAGPLNGGGATKVVLNGDWIGILAGGNFHAKSGISGEWVVMAGGGQVTDIAISSHDWFAFIGGGDFYAKQGAHASWLTMAGGGQVTEIATNT